MENREQTSDPTIPQTVKKHSTRSASGQETELDASFIPSQDLQLQWLLKLKQATPLAVVVLKRKFRPVVREFSVK